MSAPRIAAVLPAYNAAGHVANAIASLQAQTAPPDEIIVVDDGSADDTAVVAERAGARVIRQANGGPAAARNTGIRATDAEWIALLDADDTARPERLARQRERLGDPGVGVTFTGYHWEGKRMAPVPKGITFEMLWKKNWIPTSAVLLRRAAWEQVGGFDEARELIGVEDFNLWLRLAHAGWRFDDIPDVLVDYCPTAASLTAQSKRFALAELANVRRMAERLQVDPELVRAKEHALLVEYGMELFHYRDIPTARDFLRRAARLGPLTLRTRMRLWAATVMGRSRGTS